MLFSKQINNINKEIKEENEINVLPSLNENTNNINTSIILNNEEKNKFNNININEEFSNNNKEKNESFENKNNNEIKEDIDETKSNFQEKIINNTQTQLSNTHINNLIITQSSYAVELNSLRNKFAKRILSKSKVNDICYNMKDNSQKNKYKENNLFEEHKEEICLNDITPEEKLMNSIDNNIIDNVRNEEDLKEIEIYVEKLLGKVRCKIGNEENDPIMNKMIEKYSKLIFNKINEK